MRTRYLALTALALAACAPDSAPAPTAVLARHAVASATAPITVFTDRASFDAAAPGLPVESFLNGIGSNVRCPSPLSALTDNACFPLGAILPGITFSTTTGADFHYSGTSLRATWRSTEGQMVLDFAPGVTAVAMDLWGGSIVTECEVDVYGEAGALLSESIPCVQSNRAFFGVTSAVPVTRIVFNAFRGLDGRSGLEFVANVAFGDVNPRSKDDCMNGGWERFRFKNQGQCVRYVETGKDSR